MHFQIWKFKSRVTTFRQRDEVGYKSDKYLKNATETFDKLLQKLENLQWNLKIEFSETNPFLIRALDKPRLESRSAAETQYKYHSGSSV